MTCFPRVKIYFNLFYYRYLHLIHRLIIHTMSGYITITSVIFLFNSKVYPGSFVDLFGTVLRVSADPQVYVLTR